MNLKAEVWQVRFDDTQTYTTTISWCWNIFKGSVDGPRLSYGYSSSWTEAMENMASAWRFLKS